MRVLYCIEHMYEYVRYAISFDFYFRRSRMQQELFSSVNYKSIHAWNLFVWYIFLVESLVLPYKHLADLFICASLHKLLLTDKNPRFSLLIA